METEVSSKNGKKIKQVSEGLNSVETSKLSPSSPLGFCVSEGLNSVETINYFNVIRIFNSVSEGLNSVET